MQRFIIEDHRNVPPFNEPASLLTIGVKPLKIHHEDLFAKLFKDGIGPGVPLGSRDEIVYVQ